MQTPSRVGAWIVGCMLLLARPAYAENDDQQAGRLFEQGLDCYQRGLFQCAIDRFSEAYKLKPDPVLLYNRARAYDGLFDLAHALADYEAYLRGDPQAKDRGAIEQKIASMRALLQRPVPPPPPPPTQPRSPRVAPWIVAGVGGVGIATGTVFGIVATLRHRAAALDATQDAAARDNATAKSLATVANVAWIGGGVLAIGGIVWGILDARSQRAAEQTGRSSVEPVIGLGWVGVRATLP